MDVLNLALIAVVIAASAITFRFIEEPARRAVNRAAARLEAPERGGRTPAAARASARS